MVRKVEREKLSWKHLPPPFLHQHSSVRNLTPPPETYERARKPIQTDWRGTFVTFERRWRPSVFFLVLFCQFVEGFRAWWSLSRIKLWWRPQHHNQKRKAQMEATSSSPLFAEPACGHKQRKKGCRITTAAPILHSGDRHSRSVV